MTDFIALHQQLNRIERMLIRLLQGEHAMALDLSRINAAVENETTVDQSILTLVETMADELRNSGSDDPAVQAALDAAATQMETNAQAIVAAVAANTPAPPLPFNPADASYATFTDEQAALFTFNEGKPEDQQAPSLSFDEVNAARNAAGLENFPEDQRPA